MAFDDDAISSTGHSAPRPCSASSNPKSRCCRRSRCSPIARRPISTPTATGCSRASRIRQSGLLAITIQSFLIRQNGLTILVDACGGNDKERARGRNFIAAQWPWLRPAARGRRHARGHRHRAVHASARRSRRLEHAAGERPLGADVSQRALSDRRGANGITGGRRARRRSSAPATSSPTACCRFSMPARPS